MFIESLFSSRRAVPLFSTSHFVQWVHSIHSLIDFRFDCRRDLIRWVSVWKSRSVSFVLKKRKFDSLCSLLMHQRGILLLHLRFDSLWDWVCWVSVFESRCVSFVLKKRKLDSLCSLVMHQTEILLLELRFDSIGDWVCWVSVFESRCVSFVLKKRKFDSLCSLVMHQTGILLLHLWFDCCGDWVCWVSVWKSRSVSKKRKWLWRFEMWQMRNVVFIEGECRENPSTNRKETRVTVFPCVSSSLKRRMCKNMSKIESFQVVYTRS